MQAIGIIPARYASSRFPGKPLIDLKGKSMIQRVYEGASKSQHLNEVIVATDDQRIFNEVKSFGGLVRMTSESHVSGTDRCGEVAKEFNADIVVNIQGDEPLVDALQIDALCEAFKDEHVDIATLGHSEVTAADRENPNRIKLVIDKNKNALYFSRNEIPSTQRASDTQVSQYPFLRHIGLYAYRGSVLKELVELEPCPLELIESLEQLRWLFNGYTIRVIETTIESPNIDTPEDVEKVLPFL